MVQSYSNIIIEQVEKEIEHIGNIRTRKISKNVYRKLKWTQELKE